jgi:hypothetical protein
MPLFDGLNRCLKRIKAMKVLLKPAFGLCVIAVSLFSTGCATGQYQPMAVDDLDRFQIDCRIKAQQIRFLQGMRATQDDRFLAGATNLTRPWTVVTAFPEYKHRVLVNNGYTNWSINQLLMRISHDCP